MSAHSYAVALVFDDGPIVINVLLAPSPEAASVMLLNEYVRGPNGVPVQPLTGIAVCPISPEWLRRALGESEEPRRVVRLAPQLTPVPSAPTSPYPDVRGRCMHHGIILDAGGRCPVCEPGPEPTPESA